MKPPADVRHFFLVVLVPLPNLAVHLRQASNAPSSVESNAHTGLERGCEN